MDLFLAWQYFFIFFCPCNIYFILLFFSPQYSISNIVLAYSYIVTYQISISFCSAVCFSPHIKNNSQFSEWQLQLLLLLIKVWVFSYFRSRMLISKRWSFMTHQKKILSLVHRKMLFTFTFQRFSQVNNQYLLCITPDGFGSFVLLI